MELRGAHAIVTGGSSGIGLATAKLLEGRGARVSIVARDPERLEVARREAGAVAAASIDVTDAEAVDRGFAALTATHGPCDLLVACAGTAHPGYFVQLEAGVFRAQMEVDYFGTLHAIRAVAPDMVARRHGTIVGVASTAALLGVFGYSAYAPAKFAVRGLCETLRAELGVSDVHVACVYPPDTLTPGFDHENELKPRETAAVSAAIKPRAPEVVATAIVRGIERGRASISADPQTALLLRTGSLVGPVVDWSMRRAITRMPDT